MSVEIQLCNDCKTETVYFHAGTLRSYLEKEPYAEHKLRKLKASQWVSFCPECHAGVLKPEGKNFDLPVFCSDGVFRTSTDLLKNQAGEPEAIWDFWGLRFTPAALINASELLQFTYPGTERVEQLGKELRTGASDDSIGFSKEVCRWGGGLRVEVVKKRGYRWDGDNRHWWTIVSEDAYAEETAFLNALCGTAAAKNVFEKISQTSRYVANS